MDTEPEAQRSGGCAGCLTFLGLCVLIGAIAGAVVGAGAAIMALPFVFFLH
jgi:hypothetical protein